MTGGFIRRFGGGKIELDRNRVLSGNTSLAITADPNESIVLEKPIFQMTKVDKGSLIILIWGEKYSNREFGIPLLKFDFSELNLNEETDDSFKIVKPFIVQNSQYQLRTGLINDGVGMELNLSDKKVSQSDWAIRVVISKIPPGRYQDKIEIFCPKGQTISYNGVRLFI